MKKLVSVLLVLTLMLSASAMALADGEESFEVGICQYMPHQALNAATQGFKDVLIAEFGEAENAGDPGVHFQEGNAGGEDSAVGPIISGFTVTNVDLILANATAPLQVAAATTDSIPILGTSITDYATALGIDDWTGTVGGNVSGTSDLAPLDQQAEVLHEMFPDAKVVGLLYCSGEANSIYQVNVIKGYLESEDMGYECKLFPFNDVNDLPAVTQKACDDSDVIYVPTDNKVADNTETIANIVIPAGVPVVAGEENICAGCGVVTLSISYYDLGTITGQMAVKILKGEADISEMPVEFAPEVTKEYNADICAQLKIEPPEGYVPIGGEAEAEADDAEAGADA